MTQLSSLPPIPAVVDMQGLGTTKDEAASYIQRALQDIALGRVGQPDNVANAALFLASDDSSFITGQVIVVDGGRMDFFSHA